MMDSEYPGLLDTYDSINRMVKELTDIGHSMRGCLLTTTEYRALRNRLDVLHATANTLGDFAESRVRPGKEPQS